MQVKKEQLNVAFVGNPNCGKTTLFNSITGANLKVANWPGVTVERKEGKTVFGDVTFNLIDLPGTYSLNSYTMEEKLTQKAVLDEKIDLLVNVVDASNLERNLFLTLQLIETGKPIIIAMNMMDIVKNRGVKIDVGGLRNVLGLPIVPVSAKKKTGLNSLLSEVYSQSVNNKPPKIKIRYSEKTEQQINLLSDKLKKKYQYLKNIRWHAIKTLEGDKDTVSHYPVPADISDFHTSEIVNERYDFIETTLNSFVSSKSKRVYPTDKIDKLLTHNTFGILIFLAIMALVFTFTFTLGNVLRYYLENFFSNVSEIVFYKLNSFRTKAWLVSLIVDGILAGVFEILSFLPNIGVLFLCMGILEDSGYMARIAYVMDGIMSKLGLCGKSSIPMILGFGCSVPAVLAARTLGDEQDRKSTIFLIPFMSCSAKIPIYILFSSIFFEKYAIIVTFTMYLTGIVIAVIAAKIKNHISKTKSKYNLLIELPEYRCPNTKSVLIYANGKIKEYTKKAGSVIFIASILLFLLTNLNFRGLCGIENSFAAQIGKTLVPIFRPIGLGYWPIIVSLIAGIAAKEVVVSSLVIIYGSSYSSVGNALFSLGFNFASAISMMIFCLLYVPCIAAVATIRSETRSNKFTLKNIAFQTLLAWFSSFFAYNVLSILFC